MVARREPYCPRCDRKRRKHPGSSYCLPCKRAYFHDGRRARLETLRQEAGNRCSRCGYKQETRILEFHHRDRETKRFNIADGRDWSLETLRRETAKCDLLCPNCHSLTTLEYYDSQRKER